MSKAYKCDVCGKLFESRLVPFWIKSAIKPNETLDICDSCKAEFEHWLDPTKYEECEEDNRSCHSCMYSGCCASGHPCRNCDNYSNYVDENSKKHCKNCTFYACSPTEEPCVGCVAYSKYESWTDCVNLSKENNKKEVNDDKSCSNCTHNDIGFNEHPCSECINYEYYKEVNND